MGQIVLVNWLVAGWFLPCVDMGIEFLKAMDIISFLKPKWKRKWWSRAQEKFVFFQLVNAVPLWSNEFLILVFGWHFCWGNCSHFDLSFLLGQQVESAFISYSSDLFWGFCYLIKRHQRSSVWQCLLPVTKASEKQPKSNGEGVRDLFTTNTVTGAISHWK